MHPESPRTTDVLPEEDKLMSLPDMIFGGKLTSILVCQKCKHVSQTYEDFNDISLSIKAEDYHERKRDRLKNLAKRLTSFPTTTLAIGSEIPRSSSVPPSPREREAQRLGGHEEPPMVHDPRRRSLDIVADPGQEADSERSTTTSKEDVTTTESDGSRILVNGVEVKEEKHIAIVETAKVEKKEKKDKKDDGWAKIGRRISMTVGLSKGSKEKERRSRSRDRDSRDLTASSPNNLHVPTSPAAEGRTSGDSSCSTPRTSTSETPQGHTPAILLSRPSTPPSTGHEPVHSPRSPSPTRFPNIARTKSPKPSKPSSAELEYLRQILADITPSSSSPFALFKPGYHHSNSSNRSVSAGSSSAPAHNLWLSMSQFSGIEECLRMFTAVEILDGENMVGCRRCWKIANGEYVAKEQDGCDEDSDSVDHGSTIPDGQPITVNGHALPPPLSPPALMHLPTSMSTPTVSFYTQQEDEANRSVSSLPPHIALLPEGNLRTPEHARSPLIPIDTNPTPTPGGMPIPSISTTAPNPSDPPSARPLPPTNSSAPRSRPLPPTPPRSSSSSNVSTPVAHPTPRLGQVLAHLPLSSISKDSLPLPNPRRQPLRSEIDSADESSGSGAESENSVATSALSVESSSTSAGLDHQNLHSRPYPPPHSHSRAEAQAGAPTKKPARPKPVIMRPAYKRYLIGTPPPVLVIHLKRFQQISKTHMLSFSHGFRKLDDYVTFPELLDLTPYLAPKKEDFGLGKVKHGRKKAKDGEKCMYRLYAVVVHIGNMVRMRLSPRVHHTDNFVLVAWGPLYCIHRASYVVTACAREFEQLVGEG
jgi:ubiquitin carboxyl-terminal hydrolase 16/45